MPRGPGRTQSTGTVSRRFCRQGVAGASSPFQTCTTPQHLNRLGAQFAIEPFSTNYMGQAPRVDDKRALRGRSVTLSGAPRNFADALSEGDKRCLAFSFFATSVLRDEQSAEKIVVIDDPVSSLDRSRGLRLFATNSDPSAETG